MEGPYDMHSKTSTVLKSQLLFHHLQCHLAGEAWYVFSCEKNRKPSIEQTQEYTCVAIFAEYLLAAAHPGESHCGSNDREVWMDSNGVP